jgi:hypothetical protein
MNKFRGLFVVFFVYIFLPANGFAQEQFKIDIHGFISQGFLYSNRNNYLADTGTGTFQFNELGINFAADLTDKLRLGIQLAARDLGDIDNDRVVIDWAYADYRWQDWLGIRVGKMRLPLGFYNKTRDMDMLRTFIFLPQSIYSETFRDSLTAMKGIEGYGVVPLKALGNICYEAVLGTINLDNESSLIKSLEDRGWFKIDKYELGKLYSWAITWETPLKGLQIGISQGNTDLKFFATLTEDLIVPVAFPPYTMTAAQKDMTLVSDMSDFLKTVYSLEYTVGELILAVEYDREDFTVIDRIDTLEHLERKHQFESFYGSASYRFNKWFEAGLYYSVFYRDRDDRDGSKTPYNPTFSAFQKDACLTFRFDLNDHWTFKLEGHLMDGTALLFYQENLNDSGILDVDRKWYFLAAKMTFNF